MNGDQGKRKFSGSDPLLPCNMRGKCLSHVVIAGYLLLGNFPFKLRLEQTDPTTGRKGDLENAVSACRNSCMTAALYQ